jgi:pectate lyase
MMVAAACSIQAATRAFPGADGFGADTPGGRGGKVLFVRNLNDAGPGSLREAVSTPGPRIVVFRVSGLITLQSPLKITEPYITIAGQTAPGDGICLRANEVNVLTHDVVVRYLRFRPGDISPGEVDGLDVMHGAHHVVIDHCSNTWSIDENLSPSGDIHDVTVQWCLIAEGLNRSIHKKGAHGYGSLVRAIGGLTLHHNLWAHNDSRNPRLGDNYSHPPYPVFDVRNNVMYDYGHTCSGLTGDHLSANYVANYVRPGPSSVPGHGVIVLSPTAAVTYYVKGNVVEGRPEWTANNLLLFDKKLFTTVEKPFEAPPVHTTTAEQAFRDVAAGVGATLPRRDAVDQRILAEMRDHSGSVIDSQWEVGGWPEYHSARPPVDSDLDGIPDAWEKAHGLDPQDATDAAKTGAGGYTNLEIYLNSLVAEPANRSR